MTHDFYEDGWDKWSVFLRTKDRDVDIRLDLYTNLDQILSASNEQPVLDYYDDDGATDYDDDAIDDYSYNVDVHVP